MEQREDKLELEGNEEKVRGITCIRDPKVRSVKVLQAQHTY